MKLRAREIYNWARVAADWDELLIKHLASS